MLHYLSNLSSDLAKSRDVGAEESYRKIRSCCTIYSVSGIVGALTCSVPHGPGLECLVLRW